MNTSNKTNNSNTSKSLNILATKEILSHSQLELFNKQIRSESIFFNKLKSEGKTNYHRHPHQSKSGKWYIEQLVRNTNGTYSLVKVLVNRIKSGKFTEQVSPLLSESFSSKVKALGLSFS